MFDFRQKKTADKNTEELAFTELFDLADNLLYRLRKIDYLTDQIYTRLLLCHCSTKNDKGVRENV